MRVTQWAWPAVQRTAAVRQHHGKHHGKRGDATHASARRGSQGGSQRLCQALGARRAPRPPWVGRHFQLTTLFLAQLTAASGQLPRADSSSEGTAAWAQMQPSGTQEEERGAGVFSLPVLFSLTNSINKLHILSLRFYFGKGAWRGRLLINGGG